MTFQDTVRARVKERRWTLVNLSMRSRVPYRTIEGVASGRVWNPQLRTAVKIAKALDIDLREVTV